ncbi:thioredoxin-related transmembrane 1 isoform X2 [Brachionus plicatilis]|uniref:Thioredoxin-related transmembrane 1 isoform X2 n=1 Tax=Brachionus plicatilis TaxID=10195 RepID=A0A3M7R5T6_BRAPC|nr:thioredoxin-related transmembrane 1 isoform X2 [Brachionus plicatilis]
MKFLTLLASLVLVGACFAKLIEINEENWEHLLSKDEWMVEFFAPWCPACNRFESTWNEFSQKSAQLNIKVGAADVNANPVLSGLFSVTSLPTIYHVKDGQYRIYNSNRDLNSLVKFVSSQEWKSVDPSSSWLAPNSFLIKALSLLFKLTIYFKDIYTTLTETYGYPVWVVLTIFVVVTISLGLILGVLFIILIDFICPPKRASDEEIKEINDDDVVYDEKDANKEASSEKDSKTKENKKDN